MDLWSTPSGVWGSTMVYLQQIGWSPPWNSWKLTLLGGIRLRVMPYTHSQLIKVQKHFIHIWYGFVKHSKWGVRLNHDVTTLYIWYGLVKHSKWGLRLNHDVSTADRLVPTLKFLKIDPTRGYQAKGDAIHPFTAYQGAETLYSYMILHHG